MIVIAHQLILRQKVKDQGYEVQKRDRMAGVSYGLYRVPNL